jgi:hypothetical protein
VQRFDEEAWCDLEIVGKEKRAWLRDGKHGLEPPNIIGLQELDVEV